MLSCLQAANALSNLLNQRYHLAHVQADISRTGQIELKHFEFKSSLNFNEIKILSIALGSELRRRFACSSGMRRKGVDSRKANFSCELLCGQISGTTLT